MSNEATKMVDGKARKDASRLLMSLGQHTDPRECEAVIRAYLRSYFEAGYARGFELAEAGRDDHRVCAKANEAATAETVRVINECRQLRVERDESRSALERVRERIVELRDLENDEDMSPSGQRLVAVIRGQLEADLSVGVVVR